MQQVIHLKNLMANVLDWPKQSNVYEKQIHFIVKLIHAVNFQFQNQVKFKKQTKILTNNLLNLFFNCFYKSPPPQYKTATIC